MGYKTGLEAWWGLNEEAGERVDSHGVNNLTDNNTVLFGAGKKGNAADLEETNSEYLNIVDNASLSTGNIDFTFAALIKMEALTTRNMIAAKGDGTAFGDYEWYLEYHNAVDALRVSVQDGTDDVITVEDSNIGNDVAAGVWYCVFCWHDSVANEVGIQVNNGVADTAAYAHGSFDSNNGFQLGRLATIYCDSLIDEAAFWKRILTADEKTWLYNGGAYRAYSELDAVEGGPRWFF